MKGTESDLEHWVTPETAAAVGASHCRKAVRLPAFSSARR